MREAVSALVEAGNEHSNLRTREKSCVRIGNLPLSSDKGESHFEKGKVFPKEMMFER